MQFLVRHPVVALDQVWPLPVGQKLKPPVITMAIQADRIVIDNRLSNIFIGPCIDLVGMWIVAHPAGKIITVFFRVNAFLEFCINFLKIEMSIGFVTRVSIQAGILVFHAKVTCVGEVFVILRMTISTFERPMI